jgi:hypothetical protein
LLCHLSRDNVSALVSFPVNTLPKLRQIAGTKFTSSRLFANPSTRLKTIGSGLCASIFETALKSAAPMARYFIFSFFHALVTAATSPSIPASLSPHPAAGSL